GLSWGWQPDPETQEHSTHRNPRQESPHFAALQLGRTTRISLPGRGSQSQSRKGRRPTLNKCLVPGNEQTEKLGGAEGLAAHPTALNSPAPGWRTQQETI